MSKPTLQEIGQATMVATGLNIVEIKSSSRKEPIVDAKQIVALIGKTYDYTDKEIASYLNRDRSSVTSLVNDRKLTSDVQTKIIDAKYMLPTKDLSYWCMKVACNPKNAYYKEELIKTLQNED